MGKDNCKNGVCEVPTLTTTVSEEAGVMPQLPQNGRIIYVGDPMCSWCYGIAEVVKGLQAHCDSADIAFDIVVGGLRSGGADQWTPEFRGFLKDTWIKIEATTGQPFDLALLDQTYFDYDTTPSCEAVVAAKALLPADNGKSLAAFFEAIQIQFYLKGQDPKRTEFYQEICDQFKISYSEFKSLFEGDSIQQQTRAEFQWRSSIGVNSFPSFLWMDEAGISLLDSGYTSLSRLIRRIPYKENTEN